MAAIGRVESGDRVTALRHFIVGSLLFLMGCQSCEQSSEVQEQAEELAEISTGIQFASVKELGSHQMVAQINRRVERDGVVDIENDETLILVWANDDSFQIQGLRDGRMMEEFAKMQAELAKLKEQNTKLWHDNKVLHNSNRNKTSSSSKSRGSNESRGHGESSSSKSRSSPRPAGPPGLQ